MASSCEGELVRDVSCGITGWLVTADGEILCFASTQEEEKEEAYTDILFKCN